MPLLKKIIFLLLPILFFSCQTRLEKQGWQRTAIVSQLDTSTINKKDKELTIVKIPREYLSNLDSAGQIIKKTLLDQDKSAVFVFYFFFKDSVGKIVSEQFPIFWNGLFKSDLAYYKWESDSVCLVKILNQGNVQASFKLRYNSKSLEFLNDPKK